MSLEMSKTERRVEAQKANSFVLIDGVPHCHSIDLVNWRVLQPSKFDLSLKEMHSGIARGQFSQDMTSQKIFVAGYWTPTLN